VHLMARLIAGRFALLDTQFVTPHLQTLGAIEIPRKRYLGLLDEALQGDADFLALKPQVSGTEALAVLGSAKQRSRI
jgi:leucyl/phenylalanyl-tRNA---protein transferase